MEHRLPVGTPGEPGDIPLPWGRLHFEQVCAALLADGLVAEHDVERMRFSAQGARNASAAMRMCSRRSAVSFVPAALP